MKLLIEQIDNRWTVNGKYFHEMSEIERHILSKFLTNIHEKTIKHL